MDIEWIGRFPSKEREALQLSFPSLGINTSDVRMVMRAVTSDHNLLLVTSDALLTASISQGRKRQQKPAKVTARIPFEDLSQVAYKSRTTRDDDLAPRRLYALERNGNISELGLLLAWGSAFDRLAAILDPTPLAIDGKLVELPSVEPPSPKGKSLFAPTSVGLPSGNPMSRNPDTPRIFVSHASEDSQAAVAVTAELERNGVDAWLATRDIDAGQNYAEQIHDAIVNSSHLVVLLSHESVASVHVQREVNLALSSGKALLPVVVSPDPNLLTSLPAAWKYWLGVVQVVPYAAPAAAVPVLLRGLKGAK